MPLLTPSEHGASAHARAAPTGSADPRNLRPQPPGADMAGHPSGSLEEALGLGRARGGAVCSQMKPQLKAVVLSNDVRF